MPTTPMELTGNLASPVPGGKTLRGESNSNHTYRAPEVEAIFEKLNILDITNSPAAILVLSYLSPKTYPSTVHPGDFFQMDEVRFSEFSLGEVDIQYRCGEDISVHYKNNFGWGEKGGSDRPLRHEPFFSTLGITASLHTRDRLYFPRAEDFTEQRLAEVIFGPKLEGLERAHPELQPFSFYHDLSLEVTYTHKVAIKMAPRDHTLVKVLEGARLFREVVEKLKEAQPEFEHYVNLIDIGSKVQQAQQKVQGVHAVYVRAFEGTSQKQMNRMANALQRAERESLASLEQVAPQLQSEKDTALHKVSERFVDTGLRDRLIDYYTQKGLSMESPTQTNDDGSLPSWLRNSLKARRDEDPY